MKLTRKEFLQAAAAMATVAAIPAGTAPAQESAPTKGDLAMHKSEGKPKRGVSFYSYSGEYGITMTLKTVSSHTT
jgi:hypothetical protein